jgi:hypothetical protein
MGERLLWRLSKAASSLQFTSLSTIKLQLTEYKLRYSARGVPEEYD